MIRKLVNNNVQISENLKIIFFQPSKNFILYTSTYKSSIKKGKLIMENEIAILSENDKRALAFKAGSSRLEAIIEETDSCVIVENTVPDNDPNANVFKCQHKSGRVYTLTQRVYNANSERFEIVWGLVTCSMHGVLFNLTNLRRHKWSDWLTDDTIDEKQQYGWFRFHGKRLWLDACNMIVDVCDDGRVSVNRSYCKDYIDRLMSDTLHLADRIQQKDLSADPNYISGTRKRKQMMEVVNSVMEIEGPAECIVKAFSSDVFTLIQKVETSDTILFDEVDIAKVTVKISAVLPASENSTAFFFNYKITVNTRDYTTECDENQDIILYVNNYKFEVKQTYKGTMPFTLQFNMTPNKEKYTTSTWRDDTSMKLSKISDAHFVTGKSFIQEFADNYLAMKPIIDAVKSAC